MTSTKSYDGLERDPGCKTLNEVHSRRGSPATEEFGGATTSALDSVKYERVDPVAVPLWRIEGALSTGIPLLGMLVGGSVLGALTPTPLWVIGLVWIGMVLLLFLTTAWLPPRKYRSWSYRLDDRVLELKYGVFWQNSVMIPLSRIQHVDLSRGPLDRRFGVASLEVYTAGTRSASHSIPHLTHDVGLRLRERLVEAAGILSE